MFEFIFGLFWTLFVTPFFISVVVNKSIPEGGINNYIILIIVVCVFEFVGLFLLVKGLKKIIKNMKTKKYGTQCYGIVNSIKKTGASVNDNPQYKAILDILNPETHQVENIEEIIGFDYNKYPINSYVLCLYYQGDINFLNIVPENEVPGDVKKYLVPVEQGPNYNNLQFSSDREYVTIDGVQYKRVQ